MRKIALATVLFILLAACNGGYIPLAIVTPIIWPSPLPVVNSPTPPFIPTSTPLVIIPATPTLTRTSTATSTETILSTYTPTEIISSTYTSTPTASVTYLPTSTYTFTPTSIPSITPTQPFLTLEILGCNTSLDILHQMGEVTNAYPVIRNTTGQNLTNVCATLYASDEARVHPDKTVCLAELPSGYQVIQKLTVDTTTGQDTSIQVVASSNEGFHASASHSSCREIGFPGWLTLSVGVIEPIQ